MITPLSADVVRRHERFGAWCGPIFLVLFGVGYLIVAHFWDPASASWSDAHVAAFYSAHRRGMEIGCSLAIVGTCFLAIWSVQLGLMMWRLEGRSPLLAIGEILGGFGVVLLIIISCCLWIGCAFRPGTDPQIVVALNDASWFGFLLGWVVLALQMLTAGVVTVHDRSATPLVPRPLAQATIVGSILLVVANGCAFVTSGPFAFNGVLGYYIPMAIWGSWMVSYCVCVLAGVRREQAEEMAAEPATVASPAGQLDSV